MTLCCCGVCGTLVLEMFVIRFLGDIAQCKSYTISFLDVRGYVFVYLELTEGYISLLDGLLRHGLAHGTFQNLRWEISNSFFHFLRPSSFLPAPFRAHLECVF